MAIFGYLVKTVIFGFSPPQGKIVKIGDFCVFVKMGDFGESGKMTEKVKNVKIGDFLTNMKYAVFCWFGRSFLV